MTDSVRVTPFQKTVEKASPICDKEAFSLPARLHQQRQCSQTGGHASSAPLTFSSFLPCPLQAPGAGAQHTAGELHPQGQRCWSLTLSPDLPSLFS